MQGPLSRVSVFLRYFDRDAAQSLRTAVDEFLLHLSSRTGIRFEFATFQQREGLTYAIHSGVISNEDNADLVSRFRGSHQTTLGGRPYLIVPHTAAYHQPVTWGQRMPNLAGLVVCVGGALYFSGLFV